MKSVSVALLFVLTSYVSQSEKSDIEEKIYGNWEWVRSEVGFLGIIRTRDSFEEEKFIRFTRDHLALLYVSDSLVFKDRYVIQYKKTNIAESVKPVLVINGLTKEQIVSFRKDTMMLRENSFDGLTHTYLKKSD